MRADIEKTGYTPGHFRRLFTKDTGMAPVEFLNLRRLQYAKTLMDQQKDRITVREVAEQSGFADAYYFSRMFKKMVGVSPKTYMSQ